jgi:hypothetical protein
MANLPELRHRIEERRPVRHEWRRSDDRCSGGDYAGVTLKGIFLNEVFALENTSFFIVIIDSHKTYTLARVVIK